MQYMFIGCGLGGQISGDQKLCFAGDRKNDQEIKSLIFWEVESFIKYCNIF
jgi:hypothetical protein